MSEQSSMSRELDAQIMRRVFGNPVDLIGVNDWRYSPHDTLSGVTADISLPLPIYSTDIAAAWEIVEWFRTRRYNVYLSAECGWQSAPDTPQYAVTIQWMEDEPAVIEYVCQVGMTMPVAICRAALAAQWKGIGDAGTRKGGNDGD